ncbi:MAG TPA: lysophospholipid acyltransferase family protein, partial [Blastocatellia bacterium]
LVCRIFFRIKFYGIENVPLTGACIITPNHQTFIDPIWLTIPMKRRIYYMAWAKVFDIPVLGFLARIFGAFPVRLDAAMDPAAQRQAAEVVQEGRALVIFPEAGRTISGELMPFKLGAFRLALMIGAPIVPIAINGGFEIWPVGKLLPRPGGVSVKYLPPIKVERVGEDIGNAELKRMARDLAGRTRELIQAALPAGDPAKTGKLPGVGDPQADTGGLA